MTEWRLHGISGVGESGPNGSRLRGESRLHPETRASNVFAGWGGRVGEGWLMFWFLRFGMSQFCPGLRSFSPSNSQGGYHHHSLL